MNIVLNKIFTGSYVDSELGHEFKNFLVCDDGTRGIYIVPHGRIGREVDYVIHVIGAEEKNTYEILGISKVKEIKISDEKINEMLSKTINGINFRNIFNEDIEVKSFSGIADKFFVPIDDKRVLIKTMQKNNDLIKNGNEIIISMSEKKFGRGEANHIFPTSEEIKEFEKLFNDHFDDFFDEEVAPKLDIHNLKSELPFCVISSRVSLELSISNMIAYFLKRDKKLLNDFIYKFLDIEINDDEEFQIHREERNVDIILKNDRRIIVIENKVDSNINGIKSNNYSQLSKYVEYVNKKYPKHLKHFFILKPDYSIIDENKIKEYKYGNEYVIKSYGEFFDKVIKNHKYRVNYKKDLYSQFLFDEFKTNVEYLSWSKAKKTKQKQLILLKQIIDENII